jgi:ATP-dependent DNA helicase RecG
LVHHGAFRWLGRRDPSMSASRPTDSQPLQDAFVDQLLERKESHQFEVKRAKGKLARALESIVAFANTTGGTLVLGLEDPAKATGRDRVHGLQESPTAGDELRRLVANRVTPRISPTSIRFTEVRCSLRNGSKDAILLIEVDESLEIHSIADGGTWVRLGCGNRQLAADEITRLALAKGSVSAESSPAQVDCELLDTDLWKAYSSRRRLTRPIDDALLHIGLAARDEAGQIRPRIAAVLLFADHPGGLLATKAGIRVLHYKGDRVEHGVTPNLLKAPTSFSGPLTTQILQAVDHIVSELATGVQVGPLGFESVQRYPLRVIREAVTNAVIHRDYWLQNDIHIRLFANRIEIESPGSFPRGVNARNIQQVGSRSRNPLLASHLREFPNPPNLDAGEGVRMMFQTMNDAGLYPPQYQTGAVSSMDRVIVHLLNEARPSIWDQVCTWLDKHGSIGNAELRELMQTENVSAVSRTLQEWVKHGLLMIANPDEGKKRRRYRLAEDREQEQLFADHDRKQLEDDV